MIFAEDARRHGQRASTDFLHFSASDGIDLSFILIVSSNSFIVSGVVMLRHAIDNFAYYCYRPAF